MKAHEIHLKMTRKTAFLGTFIFAAVKFFFEHPFHYNFEMVMLHLCPRVYFAT